MKSYLSIFIFSIILRINAHAYHFEQLGEELTALTSKFNIPGLVVAVVEGDQVIFQQSYGVIDSTNKIAVTDNTIFQIASLSKSFSGVALAQLQDQKLFNWYDRPSQQIAEFTLKNKAYANCLTWHDIASMQTGLPKSAGREFLSTSCSNLDFIKALANQPSISKPHSQIFSYQYGIFALIEELIQRKSGLDYANYMQQKLFIPLKLYQTGIGLPKLTPYVARPHDPNNHPLPMETFKLNSAAGIYSSLHDMIIWLKFNIAGGGGLISKQQLDNFRAPITPIEPNDLYEAEKITKLHYGYFWRNFDYNSLGKKIKVVEHAGGCAGMTSIISYLPHEKLGIIVMSNKFTQAPEILRSKFLNLIIQQKP